MNIKKKTDKGGRIPLFWVIYFGVTATAILVVIVALQVIKDRLVEYEAVQPKYVAAEVFSRYFEPIQYEELLADARYDAGTAEPQEIVEYLQGEVGSSPLTYSIGTSNEPNEMRYIVKAGAKQFASINLRLSENQSQHGFDTYEFSYIELYLNTEDMTEPIEFMITIEAPSFCSVMVDGQLLSEEFIVSKPIRTDFMPSYLQDVEGVEYAVYTIEGLTELPEEVLVTDPEGQNAEISFDENTDTYTAGVIYSQTLAEEYSGFGTEAMEKYAEYVQASDTVGLNSIKGYFDTDSDLYADVVAAGGSRWMVLDWDNVSYEDVSVGEFYAHTPEMFSCHISFTQLLHRTGREDYTDYVDKYVFLHLTDNGYKIFRWYNV